MNVYPQPGYANTGLRKLMRIDSKGSRLTQQGISFLKCAFAPPDFAANDVAGVPDSFHGASLTKKHRMVNPFVCPASMDTYILVLPTPGIAYWTASVAAGTQILAATVFTGVNYSDFATMFGGTATSADIVNKFRFVSQHIEIVPTVNQMTWTGSFQAWKFPCIVSLRENGASTANLLTVTGLQSCNATNANEYVSPFNLGLFCGAYNSNAQFDFQPILEDTGAVPSALVGGDFGTLNPPNAFTGLDSGFESLCIKISAVGTNANNSMLIKTWACVEYQCMPGNLLYEFTSLSPTDDLALKVYREVINGLPVAVPFLENENFWTRVLNIIRNISGGLSVLPGPYGLMAGGVNAITTGLSSVLL